MTAKDNSLSAAAAVSNKESVVTKNDVLNESNCDEIDTVLTNQVTKLSLTSDDDDAPPPPLIICDAGYGLPSQVRPRKEKISAITKQLYNFLDWQMKSSSNDESGNLVMARVKVVGATDVTRCLQERLEKLWDSTPLPSHVEFSSQTLEQCVDMNKNKEAVYLSPDATDVLDPSKPPPPIVVVGLLIDRRIQLNRSMNRATSLHISTARWPLEEFSNIDSQEPLNVDTVVEGMQEWYWNSSSDDLDGKECFLQAATSAIERHAQRHPNRPLHKTL